MINDENRVSAINRSSTLLVAGASYTGEWEDVSMYPAVVTACLTDQDGTLTVQFSPDGVNIDSQLVQMVSASTNEVHRYTVTRQFVRVLFTNTSASNQTYLRLQVILSDAVALNQSINSAIQQDADSSSVRPTDFKYEVALGRRSGHTLWNKFGFNSDIDIGTETIWSAGGTFSRMTSADTFDVVSTSANDTSAGTGARTLTIYGLDESYEEITEVVTLNGTTPVVTTNQWFGVNRMVITTVGSGGTNAGVLTAKVTTGGTNTQAHIPIGLGSSQQAIFFVPNNHTALMDWLYITMVKNAGGTQPKLTVKMWVTNMETGVKVEAFRDYLNGSVENHTELLPSQPFVCGEKCFVEFQGTTDVDNTEVGVRFSLCLVKDF